MAFSVTFMVAANFPVTISDSAQEPTHFRRGDIVNVRPYGGTLDNVSNAAMVFVHVTDIPDAVLPHMKQRWRRSHTDAYGTPLHRCAYWLRYMDAPQGVQDTLASDRQVTVTWAQIKGYIRDKVADADYS